MVVVTTVGYAVVALSQYAVAFGGGESTLLKYYSLVPTAGGWREAFGGPSGVPGPEGTQYLTARLIGLWTHVLFLGMVGFVYSYFWSASTIIYFLLRRDVDETELEEIYLEEEEEEPFPSVAPSIGAAPPEPPSPSGGPDPLAVVPPPGQ